MISEVIIKNKIIPKRIKYNGDLYNILTVDMRLIIYYYILGIIDGKIYEVRLRGLDSNLDNKYGIHPNADNNNIFCLPSEIIGSKLESGTIKILRYLIETYNLDNCYFMPWGMVEYERSNNIATT